MHRNKIINPMEMKVQFHHKVRPVIRVILTITLFNMLFSCASSEQNLIKKDTYGIINKAISIIEKNEKKDSIFIDTLRIYPEYIRNYVVFEDVKNIFTAKEIQHMKKQSSQPFYINMRKINSNRVFSYKKPEKKLDDKGVVVLTGNLIADPFRAVYYLSKPVFTLDGMHGIILIYQRYQGNWFWLYKKENKEWTFFRQIIIGIE